MYICISWCWNTLSHDPSRIWHSLLKTPSDRSLGVFRKGLQVDDLSNLFIEHCPRQVSSLHIWGCQIGALRSLSGSGWITPRGQAKSVLQINVATAASACKIGIELCYRLSGTKTAFLRIVGNPFLSYTVLGRLNCNSDRKGRLGNAAGAKFCGESVGEKLHAAVARNPPTHAPTHPPMHGCKTKLVKK